MFFMSYGYNPTVSGAAGPFTGESHEAVEAVTNDGTAGNNLSLATAASLYSGNRPFRRLPDKVRLVKDYAGTVEKRAKEINSQFEKRQLPYRIKVTIAADESVQLDLSIVNESGSPVNYLRRNISDDDFSKLMDDITSGKGIIFDNVPGWSSYH
jgi:hypothetical protein